MANKKKDSAVFEAATMFMSQPQPAESADAEPVKEIQVGRPKSRGPVARASLFLDADLATALKIQAALENKSVSILISDIARAYLTEKGTFQRIE